ncbi:MAG: 3-deoxy-D-manno-octulosonic acid transferase [Candidatus Hydrogenedentes bacterium]|nr:3-deoxy-D-manno-octulosonic acid transferase [Candidatus Hydrogenedentota bacterium]
MSYFIYNVALAAAEPLARIWLARHPGHAALRERFDPPVPPLAGRPVWVHACSVGEINTARPLIRALQARFPGVPVLLTTSTAAGRALADKGVEGAVAAWLPFDRVRAVRRFIGEARPRALVILETELWPNLLREARRAGVPVIIANGRISPKRLPRYRRWRRVLAPVFRQVSAVGAQNAAYAALFTELGVAPEAVHVTGNLKFDAVRAEVDPRTLLELRLACGFGPDTPILLFGSTRPGDETLAADCWRALAQEFPQWRLVVAPRHLQRVDEAVEAFGREACVLRTETLKPGRRAETRVLVLDTLGELGVFYGLAEVAVIGGSFYPGVDGHNPLESAALGVATVYGPYMGNFPEASEALLESGGAVQVAGPGGLEGTVRRLMTDAHERRALGTRGRRAVVSRQGASEASVALVCALLGGGGGT